MKNAKVSFTVLIISITFLFSSCKEDQIGFTSTEQLLIASPWKVEYFFQTHDLTSQFGNVRLLFSNTGTVAVQKENETVYGSWLKTLENNSEVIHLQFNSSDVIIEMLQQNWKLVEKTPNSLQFEETDPALTSLRIRMQ